MCFSTEVSFGAAIVISTVGVISYKKANHTTFRFLALVPILFGIQQFSEGIVWLASSNEQLSSLLKSSTYFYIIFAWLIWPVYIPFTFWKLEQDVKRKKILRVLILLGICIAILLSYVILFNGVNTTIQNCSILYRPNYNYPFTWLFGIFYLMATVLPAFISSVKKMWILGGVHLLSFFVSKIYFNENVISIWCFFAAISSVLILLIIQQNVQPKAGKVQSTMK